MHLQILYVSVYSYTGVVDLSRGALHMVPGCVVLSLVYCYVEGVALFIQVDYASMSYAYITHWHLCVIPTVSNKIKRSVCLRHASGRLGYATIQPRGRRRRHILLTRAPIEFLNNLNSIEFFESNP